MENIQVIARMRPMTTEEKKNGDQCGWKIDLEKGSIECIKPNFTDHIYYFDNIYGENIDTNSIYQKSIQSLIQNAVQGIDTTIYAFGQTGAGKTHTMLGSDQIAFTFNGIIYLAIQDIFTIVNSRSQDEQFFITVSYTEIYNEQVFDLLAKHEDLEKQLQIFEEPNGSKFKVLGQTKVRVETLEEVKKIIYYGETNRKYSETYFNHTSSRSHTIFGIQLKNTTYSGEEAAIIRDSAINIVDLAGNERLMMEEKTRNQETTKDKYDTSTFQSEYDSHATPRKSPMRKGTPTPKDKLSSESSISEEKQRLLESKNINKSLFYLTQIINQCSREKKPVHIPFRNSALTKILKSSFGGNTRTLILLCFSPNFSDVDVSISTFRFGKCAKKIQYKIKPNVITAYSKEGLEAIIDFYEKKIEEAMMKGNDLRKFFEKLSSFDYFLKEIKVYIANDMISSTQDKLKKLGWKDTFKVTHPQKLKKCKLIEHLHFKCGILNFYSEEKSSEKIPEKKTSEKISEEKISDPRFSSNIIFQKKIEMAESMSNQALFDKFQEKCAHEAKLTETVTEFCDDMKHSLVEYSQQIGDLFYKIEKISISLEDQIAPLLETISKQKYELSLFDKLEEIQLLSDQELQLFSRKIDKASKMYKEEILTREILRQANEDLWKFRNISFSDRRKSVFHKPDRECFQNLKSDLDELIKDMQNKAQLISNDLQFDIKLQDLSHRFSVVVNEMSQSTSNIQNHLFKYTQSLENNLRLSESKITWIERLYDESKNMPRSVVFETNLEPEIIQITEAGRNLAQQTKLRNFEKLESCPMTSQSAQLVEYIKIARISLVEMSELLAIKDLGLKDKILQNFEDKKDLVDGLHEPKSEGKMPTIIESKFMSANEKSFISHDEDDGNVRNDNFSKVDKNIQNDFSFIKKDKVEKKPGVQRKQTPTPRPRINNSKL